MAEVQYSQVEKGYGWEIVTWPNMKNGDTGKPYNIAYHDDNTVQVFGTFGLGGSVAVEGTNNTALVNFVGLDDSAGTLIAITSEKILSITQNPLYIRPHVTAGDTATNLTVKIRLTYDI